MRARLSLAVSTQSCELREIVLRDKPAEMLALSAKATVPVLQLTDGHVLEESLDIMRWALGCHDPQHWLNPQQGSDQEMTTLIAANDGPFKNHLDRYKYAPRYEEGTDPLAHRELAAVHLRALNERLSDQGQLFGSLPCLADFAIFPFVRQFANTDRDWFDAQPMAHLQVWLAGHFDSVLFQTVMHKFSVWAPGDAEVVFPDESTLT